MGNTYMKSRKCPKCGSREWVDDYCERAEYPDTQHDFGETHKTALIHRHCRNCHYEANELPLDAKPRGGSRG